MEQENCNWFVFYKDQILILQTENGYMCLAVQNLP